MTFADKDELDAFLTGRSYLLNVTAETVGRALEGFALPLLPSKDLDWLAFAVRRAFFISIPGKDDGPDRNSNAEIRDELLRLAELISSTWQQVFEAKPFVDDRLYKIAWRNWDGDGGNVSEPPDYTRYKSALVEMHWLSDFLRATAKQTKSQRGQWRNSHRKLVRITRAQFLAPIFEAGFGEKVTANNYPNDPRHKEPTAFMDFYSRMVPLAFGIEETTNLSEVAKEACQRHRDHPVEFGEGVIPGL